MIQFKRDDIGWAAIQVIAPWEDAEMKNRIVLNAESARMGKETDIDNCAGCHSVILEGLEGEEVGIDIATSNLK
jgi:hypothetical protein